MEPIKRPEFDIAVRQLGILEALVAYDPHIAGTPPLGVDIDTSDIDILCYAPDTEAFLANVIQMYGNKTRFRAWQWTSQDRPLIATFHSHGWEFELFASPRPVASQLGWRHYQIEKRLLLLGGDGFRNEVRRLKQHGIKTEPAFWSALEGDGDAYQGLLSLEAATDVELQKKLAAAGFIANPPI